MDAGSCNGCEIEIAAAFNPVDDAERWRTVAAMGEPRLVVVAVGGLCRRPR
ncbi:hypothetical protein [Streptomyces sp. NPDC091215]|uniref:hypothetical protein n=1 Tax=Streptomyces sp. NPDC091215 TaxID=3155192 RepID=UPI003416A930